MSPGNRPSHFGANPLHITNPTSVVITPTMTTNLPNSRTIQKLRESRGGTSLKPNACTIPRLLRDTRRAEDGRRRGDSQRLPQTGAQISPRRRQRQKGGRRKIQGDQRSV